MPSKTSRKSAKKRTLLQVLWDGLKSLLSHPIWIWLWVLATVILWWLSYLATKDSSRTAEITNNNQVLKDIAEAAPVPILGEVIRDKKTNDYIIPVKNSGKWDMFFNTGASDMVYEVVSSWAAINDVRYPDKVWASWTWEIIIPADKIAWPKAIEIKCNYTWEQRLSSGESPDCPEKSSVKTEVSWFSYSWITILWVDSTFEDDGIELSTARKLFESYGAKYFWVQGPGFQKWEGAFRVDNKGIVWKKALYVFYWPKISENKALLEDLKSSLAGLYTHLDVVEARSMEDFTRALDPITPANDIRTLLYWVGDCLSTNIGCADLKLAGSRKNNLFSKEMLRRNDIDAFYVVPATTETIRLKK